MAANETQKALGKEIAGALSIGNQMKHLGTYEALQDRVLLTGIYGDWRDLGNQKQFRTDDGAVLNWWQSKGTIYIQGKADAAARLGAALDRVPVEYGAQAQRKLPA